MSEALQRALDGALIALLGMLAACAGTLAIKLPSLLGAWIDDRRAKASVGRETALSTAADKSVAAAEERGRRERLQGSEKLEIAKQLLVSGSSSPAPLKLDDVTTSREVNAALTRMRASVPTPTASLPAPNLVPSQLPRPARLPEGGP